MKSFKYLIITLVLLHCISISMAQIHDDSLSNMKTCTNYCGFGINSTINHIDDSEQSVSDININFEIGHFLTKSISIGILLYPDLDLYDDNSVRSVFFKVTGTPFVRYNYSNNLNCSGGFGFGYGFNSFKSDTQILGTEWENVVIRNIYISLGYDILLDDGLNLRFSPYYLYSTRKIVKNSDSPNNRKDKELGISISLLFKF